LDWGAPAFLLATLAFNLWDQNWYTATWVGVCLGFVISAHIGNIVWQRRMQEVSHKVGQMAYQRGYVEGYRAAQIGVPSVVDRRS